MLAIRMQRTGRKGHAQFRIIVQESRRTPTSGSVVAQLGHYNPHAKTTVLDKEKTSFYLDHGAQPSDSVVRLLQKESVKLPSWVKPAATQSRAAKHPEKLRKNQPAKPAEPVVEAEAPAEPEPSTAEPVESNNGSPAAEEVKSETETGATVVEETAEAPGPAAEAAEETSTEEPLAAAEPAEKTSEETTKAEESAETPEAAADESKKE